MTDLTENQERVVELLPANKTEIANELNRSPNTAKGYIERIRNAGYTIDYDASRGEKGEYVPGDDLQSLFNGDEERGELNEREEFIYRSLPKSEDALVEDLGISEKAVQAHLESIEEKGWPLEGDDAGNWLGLDQDHLRSSENKGQRTREANEWWQKRHDYLHHEFQTLEWPRHQRNATKGNEEWVTHMTDLHAGDVIRREDGRVVYETDDIPNVVDYITSRSIACAEKHGSTYDGAHLLWGGDFVTGEGVYEGQHEHLDAWLDEQVDKLHDPLVGQLKRFADRFPWVQVVAQIGNHGKIRASGVTGRVNADLLLYKSIRNTISTLVEEGVEWAERVHFLLGEARPYRNFEMRDGELSGHLRHGQDRKPQAETSARELDWRNTVTNHEFDLSYIGHHHVSGRIPWSGPPVFVSGSPKPGGEFVDRIGAARGDDRFREIAHAHGVSDDGLTASYPIDSRHYDR